MIYKNKITKRNFNDLHCNGKKFQLNQNKTKIKNKETYIFSFVF